MERASRTKRERSLWRSLQPMKALVYRYVCHSQFESLAIILGSCVYIGNTLQDGSESYNRKCKYCLGHIHAPQ